MNSNQHDQNTTILNQLQIYAAQNAYFTYGVDEILNMLDIASIDVLKESLTDGEAVNLDNILEKIRLKRLRFLRSQLASSSLKSWQVNAIIKELEWDRQDHQNKVETKEAISIVLSSNIGGNND